MTTIQLLHHLKRKENFSIRLFKENDISHSIALADFPNARLVFVPQLSDPQELFQFVIESKGDVTFAESYLANIFMKTKGVTLVQATEMPIRVYENTFIFKKDDSSLRDLVDQEISEMIANKEIEELIRKYTGNQDTFK